MLSSFSPLLVRVSPPQTGSGCSSRESIFLPALAPFIAIWNAEPNARSGRKKSTATSIRNSAATGVIALFAASLTAMAMPTPAPP